MRPATRCCRRSRGGLRRTNPLQIMWGTSGPTSFWYCSRALAVSGPLARPKSSSSGCAAHSSTAGVSFQLEMRVGVVVFPTDGSRAAELLQRADLALYRAKEAGVAVGMYLEGDDSSHRHRLSILGELRRAIASNQLELHYQPKVDAATGRVAGCEALVRWRHPQQGYYSAERIHPARGADRRDSRTHVVGGVDCVQGSAALERSRDSKSTCPSTCRRWILRTRALPTTSRICSLQTGADASHVVLEVTESGAMKDLPATLRMMEQLRVLGIRFSIDDFGTGLFVARASEAAPRR